MNDKDLNNLRNQDENLHKALSQRARKRPQMPTDLNDKLMERIEKEAHRPHISIWTWMSAAVCIVAAILISNSLFDKKQEEMPQVAKTNTHTTIKTETRQALQAETLQVANTETHKEKMLESQAIAKADVPMTKTAPSVAKSAPLAEVAIENEDTTTEYVPVYKPTAPIAEEARPVYASTSNETEEDSTYQSPRKLDEFIANLASAYNVEQELHDSIASATPEVHAAIYVFPDNLEADVITRLLLIACKYNNDKQGYKLFITQYQFVFELEDTREGRRHMWFAEKEEGCTLLYCTNAPSDMPLSTACYMEFKNKHIARNTKSINSKL